MPVIVQSDDLSRAGAPTAWLAKVRLPVNAGDGRRTRAREAYGLRAAVALSVRVTAAVKDPLAAGVKITLTVQLAPARRLPASIGWAKLPH